MPMTETLLAVFAKHWTPGQVKTRLADSIGAEQAALHYRQFLATTLRRFADIAEERMVVFSPADRREDFAALCGVAWQLVPQGEGDLGARMAAFLGAMLDKTARRIVILGADSPDLPVDFVRQAFAALESSSVVLGPSDDGGYYLLGARGTPPPIFDHMPWSQPTLLAATTTRLAEHRIAAHLLPLWYDIDDEASLRRYLAS